MAEAGRRLMPLLPALCRLDGKCFHSFTRGMARPFDRRLSALMIDTCEYLVRETNASMGYTQSDEITLAWCAGEYHSQIFLDGRIQKMVSVLASMCASYFNQRYPAFFEDSPALGLANFDCRVWNVPSVVEGANAFLWREQDATKNSISMAARAYYSHKQLDNKNGPEMQEMLWQKGVNWNNYPAYFRRGTFVCRRLVSRPFSAEELERLPERHQARANPDLLVERTEYVRLEIPPFGKVTNRPEVVFMGAEPLWGKEDGDAEGE
jgi:tRNA(His) 5'-end guanylyltransferase